MAEIHLQRIRSAFTKMFDGHMDMSDYSGKSDHQKEMAFLSRAVAAYGLMLLCELSPDQAAACVTDGFDDNGIDLIHFDKNGGVLYLGQSKWADNGDGSVSQAACLKLLAGCRDVVNMRFERFNASVRSREAELRAAVESTDVRIVLFLSYSGTEALSHHIQADIDLFLREMNDTSEVFSVESFDQERIYNGLATHAQRHAIHLQILLNEWGHVTDPHPAYYGQVDATSIAQWWKDHGKNLFARNIRYFKGSTDVNNSIATTLKEQPEHFWYFNNGITILCSKVEKQILGGPGRDSGVFECQGVNVNGAQTVGMIGMMADSLTKPLEHAKVLVRLISLEHCPEGFDKTVTRAANTQNRIDSRDFAALDANQQRLASDFFLDGLRYAYKSGDPAPEPRTGCTIVDATVALACATDLALAVQAKREIGRLWDDIEGEPYTILFNDRTNATDLWKAVEIMRVVDTHLTAMSNSANGRLEVVAVHGSRFILHRVFQDPNVRTFRSPSADMARIKSAAELAADTVLGKVAYLLESQYPNAYPASFFKNHERCRELNGILNNRIRHEQHRPHRFRPLPKCHRSSCRCGMPSRTMRHKRKRCLAWWKKRKESDRAWKVKASEVIKRDDGGNLVSVNLDIKNPNAAEALEHLPPEQLVEDILAKEKRIIEIMDEIKKVLAKEPRR